jgi:hypothetical protein
MLAQLSLKKEVLLNKNYVHNLGFKVSLKINLTMFID